MGHAYGPYQLDEQGEKLRQAAARIAKEVAGKHAAEVDSVPRFPEEAIAALAGEGFFGICLPAAVGGKGQAPRVFAAVVEELAQACASTAMVYVMHVSAAQTIATSTTLAGKDALLGQIAAGKHLSTLALSEKGSRSQFWSPVSKLTPKGEGFVTNAFKSWVTSAARADSYVSSAQSPGAASPADSALYLLRKGTKGARIAGGFDGLGLRGNDSAPVSLEDLPVAGADFIYAPGHGLTGMLQAVLPWFAVGTSAMACGLAVGAVNATAGHLGGTGFEHSASQLRDLPQLRARVADMFVRAQAARALLGQTAREMEAPVEATPLFVLATRASALQTALDVTDLGMKACGGAAFSRHLPLERLFRDARAGWVMAPTVDHLHEFIGRALTGLPLL